ncbi:hypothetical protein, partial [Enterobacter asburiae]|uniref:hypothetical protein n=1 Tax=Enterobacter asburiae TaxID=61645 RepID=UPI0013D1D9DB
LHIEVKHPADGFESNGRQAEAYAARAECWSTPGKTPDRVLPHQDADTVLFCSSKRLQEFAPHAAHFGATILIEDVQR